MLSWALHDDWNEGYGRIDIAANNDIHRFLLYCVLYKNSHLFSYPNTLCVHISDFYYSANGAVKHSLRITVHKFMGMQLDSCHGAME